MIARETDESFDLHGKTIVVMHQPNCTCIVIPSQTFGNGFVGRLKRMQGALSRREMPRVMFAFFGIELEDYLEPLGTRGQILGRWGAGRYSFGCEVDWETSPISDEIWFSALQPEGGLTYVREELPATLAPTSERMVERFQLGDTMHQRIYARRDSVTIAMHTSMVNPAAADIKNLDTIAHSLVIERL